MKKILLRHYLAQKLTPIYIEIDQAGKFLQANNTEQSKICIKNALKAVDDCMLEACCHSNIIDDDINT